MHRTIAAGSRANGWMMARWIRDIRTWLASAGYRPERHYMRGRPSRNAAAQARQA